MHDSTHRSRLTPPRARLLAVAALVSGALLPGCGGSSHIPTTSRASTDDRSQPRAPQPTQARRARARPRQPTTARRRWSRSPGACAPTACPTSQTRSPEVEALHYLLEPIPQRPRSRRRRRSARSSCPAAAHLARGRRTPPHRRWRSCSDRAVHAPARRLRVPRPSDLGPGQPPSRHPGDHRFRRSDPPVPGHDQHAGAGVQAGADRVRRAATWPPPLMETGVDAGNATGSAPASRRRRLALRAGAAARGRGGGGGDRARHPLALAAAPPATRAARPARRSCSAATWSRPTPSRARSATPTPRPCTTASAGRSPGCLPSGR